LIAEDHEKYMKKICLLVNSLQSGGAEKIVISIAVYYRSIGFDCVIVLLENSLFYEIPENIEVISLTKYKSDIYNSYKFFLLPFLAFSLKRILIKNNISYVQSHTYRANYVNILCKVFGSKHVTHIVNHGIISLYESLGILGAINLKLIRSLYPKSDKIVVLSKGMSLDLKKYVKVNDSKISIINNPYDINKIVELSLEGIEKNEFNINKNKKYITSVGSLIPLKRNSDLILAFKDFQINNPDFELLFIGDGSEKDNLIDLAKELRLIDKIHFIGQVHNPYKYLSRSFVLVLNSLSEAFPNVIVEALACGCPVVSSDCYSGPREILTTSNELNLTTDKIELGEFGILYPTGNIRLLVESLGKLVNEEILYNYYKNNGINRSRQFDIELVMKKYLAIWYG
jgi:N-acetylgalactosamine-N,N'-diacetylbacillosaminyl-diphospho-undecaprenol 4-alpha-N-acetylgalactosaminyltransferase